MRHDHLQPGRRYRVTAGTPNGSGITARFTAAFVGWRPDPLHPSARWRDRAMFHNGVEVGPRLADWQAEAMEPPDGRGPDSAC